MIAPQQPFQSASLYVGDLHPEVAETFLFDMFNRVGPVASIRVCRDTVTRRSLGYAYVNFHNVADAERALDTMNFTDIKSRPCRIMWSQRDPSVRKSGVGNVFVKNLADSVDNKGLFDLFSVFGDILSCKVAIDENGVSKGYGYVHYATAEAAQEAIQKINGNILEGQEVFVSTFLRRQDRASTNDWTNLYVKMFPKSWDNAKLSELFSLYGPVNSVFIRRSPEGESMGFGFVDFANHDSAKKAIDALHEKPFPGDDSTDPKIEPYTLYVGRAQKKAERARELRVKMDLAKSEQITKVQGMNLYVKNLDETITDDTFRDLFTPFGTVTSARIMREASGSSKGFGFACFSTAEEATRAITEMNGKTIGSKPLYVGLSQRKELRQQHLAATYGALGGQPGGSRFPMQNQMGYPMNMYPGVAMTPRPQFNMMMPPRGPMNPQHPMARGYAMPGYMMPPPQGYPQVSQNRQQGGRPVPSPRAQQQRMQQAPNQPSVRSSQQANVQFSKQVRNAQGQQALTTTANVPMPINPGDLASALASADHSQQKNMLGEHLYPLIVRSQPQLAGKITGMLLEMENSELLHLIESPEALQAKISEALQVLHAHGSQ